MLNPFFAHVIVLLTKLIIVKNEGYDNTSIVAASSDDSNTTNPYEFPENFLTNTSNDSYTFNEADENSTFIDQILNFTAESSTTEEFTTQAIQETVKELKSEGNSAISKNLCTCNLESKICEVNCCCDEDCTEDDFKVFTECLPHGLPFDDKYCYQEDIFYKNNTVFKGIIYGNDQLFCIIHDNLKKKMYFRDIPSFNSIEDFNSLKSDSFSWTFHQSYDQNTSADVTKAGDLLQILYVHSVIKTPHTWSFPSHCFTKSCDCHQPVHYLEDIQSSCNRVILNLETECESNAALSVEAFANFCFDDSKEIKFSTDRPVTTDGTNQTESQISDNTNLKCVSVEEQLKPHYDTDNLECKNVVCNVEYVIKHDGINGIEDITVSFQFISFTSEVTSFVQTFKVYFEWNQNDTDIIKRSGNPGYQFGLPVIIGKRSNTSLSVSNDKITLLEKGLSTAASDSDGFCSNVRQVLSFGHNVRSGCRLRKPYTSCKSMQDEVYDILAGSSKDLFVSAFGNPNLDDVSDWLEALSDGKIEFNSQSSESSGICELVLDVELNVVYAAVGSFVNPQFKIVGVAYKYGSPQPIQVHDGDLFDENFVFVSTAVSFFDITEPAVGAFKKVPLIKATLPHDFFYPFLLSSANSIFNISMCYFVLILISSILL